MLFEKSGRKVQISTTSFCSESTSTSQETGLTLYCKFYYQLLPCSFLSRTSIPPLRNGFLLSYPCPLLFPFTRASTFRGSLPVQIPCNSHRKGLRCVCNIIYIYQEVPVLTSPGPLLITRQGCLETIHSKTTHPRVNGIVGYMPRSTMTLSCRMVHCSS